MEEKKNKQMKFFKQNFSKFGKYKKSIAISTLLATTTTLSYTFYKYQKKLKFLDFSPEEVICEELIPTETNYQKKHDQSKLFRVVVTGGPYAGKSTF